MIRRGKKRKILAAVLAAGIVLSMQGMTALAGSTGVGAAKSAQTGPGAASLTEDQSDQTGGQETAGQDQTPQPEGQPAASQDQAAQPAQGQESLEVNYSAFILQQGWSAATADNNNCSAPVNTWLTAIRANLINIPAGTQVGIRYQVNLSGSGWLPWAEDGAETADDW